MITPEQVLLAQKDPLYRERLIAENLENVRRYGAKAAGRWIDSHDDLYSEALIAFNDAITGYDPKKGKFSTFAARVINNRVTDALRKELRREKVMPFSALDQEDAQGEVLVFEPVDPRHDANDATWEIASLEQELKAFGIRFCDLPKASPKAKKTRRACLAAARYLGSSEALMEILKKTKCLPAARLRDAVGINNKAMERHRAYIIAGALICAGGYCVMAAYLEGEGKL